MKAAGIRKGSTPCCCISTARDHGALDRTVLPEESVRMVDAVNTAGGRAELVTFADAGHNAWDPAFSDPAYWSWILEQQK